ncbi:MAG: hypothetical protein ACO1SV_04820 [Fimbriimonas sp.]
MFSVAAAFGYVRLRQMGVMGFEPTVVVLALPISATLLYVLMTFLVPSLLAPGRIAFPLNLTLPVVYAALTVASVVLWTTTGSAVFQVPDVLQVAQLWKQPATLVIVGIGQAITLTALGFLSRKPSE